MSTQAFHLGDLVSVTTGRLVSLDLIGGVYRVVDFVTGIPHFTHQLPRGAEVSAPHLIKQHPWLAEITAPEWAKGEASVKAWLAEAVAKYGEYHEVQPLPFGAYVGREPIAELEEMVGKDRVITVGVDPQGGPR